MLPTMNKAEQGVPPFLTVAVGILTILITGWLGWAGWKSVLVTEQAEIRAIQFEQITGQITYLDEVLTSSARLAVGTGASRWEKRYQGHVPKLDAAIASAISLAGESSASIGVKQTENANQKLIAMETHAFDLVREGQRTAASILLYSKEYEAQKALYSSGMISFIGELRAILGDSIANDREPIYWSFATALGALVLIALLWCLLRRLLYLQQRQLVKLNDELQEASVTKSEFLATMSHEIRTPLNGVLGMVELLSQSDLSPEQRDDVKTIQESGNTLLGLLNDILDLAKVEAGNIEAELIDFSISDFLSSVDSLWAGQVQDKGMQFAIHNNIVDGELIKSDLGRLRQIINNLIGNALKFTHEGTIELHLAEVMLEGQEPKFRFEVRDTGIGLTAEQIEKLFQPFTQADSSTTRKYGGTGLGLTICRDFVHMLGGEIGVDSALAQGSTFWFTTKAERGDPDTLDNKLTGQEHGTSHKVVNDRPLRILAAEDNAINQKIVRGFVAPFNCQLDIVENGLEAVAAVVRSKYDIILMDMHMPEMDGITATQEIRALTGHNENIPIIALTANAMQGDREKYLAAGMNDHVAKPIDQRVLLRAIAHLTKVSVPEVHDQKAPTPSDHLVNDDAAEAIDSLMDDLDDILEDTGS
jgi:signal transduction histidine kinase/CheY-like chemotaxis protein